MGVSYKPLWRLLVEKELKKTDLRTLAGISNATQAKLSKNEYVSMEVLDKLCTALECQIEDIVKFVRE